MTMLDAITLLFACQLAGEVIHRLIGIPLPGSVIGMSLLFGWLALRPKNRPRLEAVTGWLTAHLAIMFVPAAVGLIEEGPILLQYGIGLFVAATLSTILTMVVTVLVFRWAITKMATESELEHE